MWRDDIKRVYDEAKTFAEAAKTLRMPEYRLRLIMKKHGWPRKPRAKPLGNRTPNRSIYDAIESGR